MLDNKRLLITGVVNADSIGYAVAHRAMELGAEVVLSSFERDRERTEAAASTLPGPTDVLDLDVTQPEHFARAGDELERRWGHLDGALHGVAFAPRAALAGGFLDADNDSVARAFATSTYSYSALAGLVSRLAPDEGASLVGLDFDAAGAWPVYNWMGWGRSASRGPRPGPGDEATGGGGARGGERIPWVRGGALAWDPTDNGPVADAVCFLFSDMARAISGEILHVDGGYHAMAANLR
ncbi:MAG: SDR family oxidoreductase [Candidatus Microthrix sp.]|nr:SDR family oxidoreductase [Candidatus Microthrix sp.]